MTNREKYLDEILTKNLSCAIAHLRTNGNKDCGIPCPVCEKASFEWLKKEYKEPETDWSKVEVDTLIEVYDGYCWKRRYFAKYENGDIYAWCHGRTSKTSESEKEYTPWSQARLVEE